MQLMKFGIQEHIKILESSQESLAEETLGKDGGVFVQHPSDWPGIAQFGLLLHFADNHVRYITLLQAFPYPVGVVKQYRWATRVLACADRPHNTEGTLRDGLLGTEQVAGPRWVVQRQFTCVAREPDRWRKNGYKTPNNQNRLVKVFPGKTVLTF